MTHLCAEGCSAYLSIKFYLIFLSLLRLYVQEPIDQTTLVHESHIIFCPPPHLLRVAIFTRINFFRGH